MYCKIVVCVKTDICWLFKSVIHSFENPDELTFIEPFCKCITDISSSLFTIMDNYIIHLRGSRIDLIIDLRGEVMTLPLMTVVLQHKTFSK